MIGESIISLAKSNRQAIVGGIIASMIVGIGVFALGEISGYEAQILLKSALPGLNLLCNTVVLASATILALILTLLGVSSNSDSKLNNRHYRQVRLVAKVDTILLIIAILLFQLSNLPILESENVPTLWFKYIYWTALMTSALLSGGLISVVLLLYQTVKNIIAVVGMGDEEHPFYLTEKEDEKEAEKQAE